MAIEKSYRLERLKKQISQVIKKLIAFISKLLNDAIFKSNIKAIRKATSALNYRQQESFLRSIRSTPLDALDFRKMNINIETLEDACYTLETADRIYDMERASNSVDGINVLEISNVKIFNSIEEFISYIDEIIKYRSEVLKNTTNALNRANKVVNQMDKGERARSGFREFTCMEVVKKANAQTVALNKLTKSFNANAIKLLSTTLKERDEEGNDQSY